MILNVHLFSFDKCKHTCNLNPYEDTEYYYTLDQVPLSPSQLVPAPSLWGNNYPDFLFHYTLVLPFQNFIGMETYEYSLYSFV